MRIGGSEVCFYTVPQNAQHVIFMLQALAMENACG